MEMDQSLLQQLMMNQTQTLDQMRQLQTSQVQMQQNIRQDQLSQQKQQMSSSSPPPSFLSGPSSMETNSKVAPITPKMMVSQMAQEAIQSRSFLMGSEELQRHETAVRQKMQLGTLNAIGGVTNTATSVGSFFLPGGLIASTGVGLGVGAAVGYGVDKMVDGAKDALNYQDILEKKGYKAFNVFEGRNDFGGVGMNLDQQQDLSGFMRDLAPEKLLNNGDLSKILSGALDGKLLKSTTDIKSFKKKFSEIVDTVKEVAVVMNGSLEEATKMLGELEARGISSGKATMMSAQAKVNASMLGVDQSTMMNQMLSTTDEMTKGSGVSAAKVFNEVGAMQSVTSGLYEKYKKDPNTVENYNYIKNNGGEATISAQGADVIQNGLGNLAPQLLVSQLGFAAKIGSDGNVTLDKEKVNQMASGQLGNAQSISELSNKTLSTLTNGQKEQFVNSVGEEAKQKLNLADNAAVWRQLIEMQSAQTGRTREGVLISMGAANNSIDAQIKADQIYNMTDQANNEFTALAAREGLAAIKRVQSPSAFQNVKGWWAGNVTNPMGDVGQAVSDEVGDLTLGLQKAINNVDSKKGVRSNQLVRPEDYEQSVFGGKDSLASQYNENMNEFMRARTRRTEAPKQETAYIDAKAGGMPATATKEVKKKKVKQDINGYLYSRPEDAKLGMNAEEFSRLAERAEEGKVSLQELATLRKDIKDGVYGKDAKKGPSRLRAQYISDIAAGEKKTKGDEYDMLASEIKGFEGDNKHTIKETRKEMKERLKQIAADKNDAVNSVMKRAKKLDGLAPEQAAQLESAIMSGNVESVEKLTNDKTLVKRMQKVGKLNEDLMAGSAASTALAGIIDNTSARTEGTEAMVGLLVSSKALDKKSAQSIFGGAIDQAKKLDKGMKKGNMSIEELEREEKLLQGSITGGFASLDDKALHKYAEGIANLSENDKYTVDSFTKNGQISRESLAQATNSIIVDGSKKGQSGLKPGKTGDEALNEHQDTMGKMIETMTHETKEMKKAIKSIKNNSGYSYTSLTK